MSRSLDTYNAKRDFKKTREPAGKAGRKTGNSFMVQKHAASRLHWDFRLELDGVLLSWAVTRVPSGDPKVKRLAVRTEDHPLSYATFEGTIPKGEYGGGTVMLWDRGTWENESDPREGLAKGKLHFTLTGERMKGEWVLIRLKPEGKAENWLLGKIDDEFATGEDLAFDTGVGSGLTMEEIAEGKTAAAAKPAARPRAAKRKGGTAPAFREPQLATLVDTPPAGNDWLHETKYDGYRALLSVGGGKCVAYTRSGLDWTAKFKPIAAAAAELPCDTALIDCEIVALDAAGKPDFGTLQTALKDGGPLLAFAFDLLELDGEDVAALPLVERKAQARASARRRRPANPLFRTRPRQRRKAVRGTLRRRLRGRHQQAGGLPIQGRARRQRGSSPSACTARSSSSAGGRRATRAGASRRCCSAYYEGDRTSSMPAVSGPGSMTGRSRS